MKKGRGNTDITHLANSLTRTMFVKFHSLVSRPVSIVILVSTRLITLRLLETLRNNDKVSKGLCRGKYL